jgi:hypothetical protein
MPLRGSVPAWVRIAGLTDELFISRCVAAFNPLHGLGNHYNLFDNLATPNQLNKIIPNFVTRLIEPANQFNVITKF